MSSAWSHAICEACWRMREPLRVPVRVKDDPRRPCCVCGAWDASGIYFREDPQHMLCKGLGPNHQ